MALASLTSYGKPTKRGPYRKGDALLRPCALEGRRQFLGARHTVLVQSHDPVCDGSAIVLGNNAAFTAMVFQHFAENLQFVGVDNFGKRHELPSLWRKLHDVLQSPVRR